MRRGAMAAVLLLFSAGLARGADTQAPDALTKAGAYASEHGYDGAFPLPLDVLLARLDVGVVKPGDVGPDKVLWDNSFCHFLAASRVEPYVIFVAPMVRQPGWPSRVRVAVEPLPSHAYKEKSCIDSHFFRFVGWQKFRQTNGFDADLMVVREVD